jgi:hypothetical protein
VVEGDSAKNFFSAPPRHLQLGAQLVKEMRGADHWYIKSQMFASVMDTLK